MIELGTFQWVWLKILGKTLYFWRNGGILRETNRNERTFREFSKAVSETLHWLKEPFSGTCPRCPPNKKHAEKQSFLVVSVFLGDLQLQYSKVVIPTYSGPPHVPPLLGSPAIRLRRCPPSFPLVQMLLGEQESRTNETFGILVFHEGVFETGSLWDWESLKLGVFEIWDLPSGGFDARTVCRCAAPQVLSNTTKT